MYKKVVLDNGVRVVLERMSSLRSVALGVWANVGSRYEIKGEEGYSHFIEHMMFREQEIERLPRFPMKLTLLVVK